MGRNLTPFEKNCDIGNIKYRTLAHHSAIRRHHKVLLCRAPVPEMHVCWATDAWD
jgi:hypothetical protein